MVTFRDNLVIMLKIQLGINLLETFFRRPKLVVLQMAKGSSSFSVKRTLRQGANTDD